MLFTYACITFITIALQTLFVYPEWAGVRYDKVSAMTGLTAHATMYCVHICIYIIYESLHGYQWPLWHGY